MALAAVALFAQAQAPDQVRRATLSGSSGTSGKCTIEVRVDGSAEVDIYGDSGRLRTTGGQSATWTRFQCSSGLPASMAEFRFRGIDGRGSVKLAQDTRNNNSMAVIRIDDTRDGTEGYTFDIEWSGGSGQVPSGSFPSTSAWPNSPASGNRNRSSSGGSWNRGNSTQSAINLCRDEVRTRGERDYGFVNLNITSADADTSQGRRNWIRGAFREGSGTSGRSSRYRFNCEVDYNSRQVRTLEILRADGSAVQAGTPSSAGGWGTQLLSYEGSYDQTKVYRSCQDSVVARTNRDGYQNVTFGSTAVASRRSDWVSGTITATRGQVTDNFDFGCQMDFPSAQVRKVELTRR
ncbi:MAG: hypothetical protein HXY18_13725 [Bryobacteraceae bacterium]|nr:hypothetical protein [Bryobacteraceae bacterium]